MKKMVRFTRDVMYSEMFPFPNGDEGDYVFTEKDETGQAQEITHNTIQIVVIATGKEWVNDDYGWEYPKDSYEEIE